MQTIVTIVVKENIERRNEIKKMAYDYKENCGCKYEYVYKL